jgi:hypothetical protein
LPWHHDTQPASALGHEHLAVGEERQTPRILQAFKYRHDLVGDGGLALRRTGLIRKRRRLSLGVRRAGFDALSGLLRAKPRE